MSIPISTSSSRVALRSTCSAIVRLPSLPASAMIDSTFQIRRLEELYPERSVVPPDPALAFVDGLRGRPSISVVSITELYAGARSRREERAIDRLATALLLLPVTSEIAQSAGQHVPAHRAEIL